MSSPLHIAHLLYDFINLQNILVFYLGLYVPMHTVPPLTPSCTQFIKVGSNPEDLQQDIINATSKIDLNSMKQTLELLPGWQPSMGDPTFGFEHPWWVANILDYHLKASQFFISNSFVRAETVTLGLGKDEYRPCKVKGSPCSEDTGGH